jgi:exodeoxyribonuclease V beta subunit
VNRQSQPRALDPETSLTLPLEGVKLIEASAGTGKTYAIGNLYLRYILSGRSVSDILVVTFTNAATEELRGRIRERLHQTLQLLERPRPVRDRFLSLLLERIPTGERQLWIDRLKLAVRSMDEAAIHTIHGFCQRVLTEHAFDSGQSFEMELASDDSLLWDEALKDWWRQRVYPLSPAEATLVTGVFPSLERLMLLQRPLRQAFGKTVLPVPHDTLEELLQRWRDSAERLHQLAGVWCERQQEITDTLRQSPALSRSKKLPWHRENLPRFIQEIDRYFRSDDLLTLPDGFPSLGAQRLIRESKPKQRGTDPTLEDPFFIECQQIIDVHQALQRQLQVAALLEASGYAAQRVEQLKQQHQTISFQDLLTRLHAALQTGQGEALAQNLRQRFPVAMIDEFQDTDKLQYGIFRRLYLDQPQTALIMIGDPKQAIYSFRGGDIFSFMGAKHDAGEERYTLDTNWRSTPPMVTAVNTIFSHRPAPFIFEQAIDYEPVKAATEAERGAPHNLLLRDGEPLAPLTLWQIPLGDDGRPRNKGEVSEALARATAAEIARLVGEGAGGQVRLGGRPVRPGDIAVLVRTSFEGASVRTALQKQGIDAVTVARDKVFDSDEARGLELLLQAIIQCDDRAFLRNALSSSLLGLSYQEMADTLFQEERWLTWVEGLRALNRLWQRKGFMPMFQAMLQQLGIGLQLATWELPERSLTNLLHLAELLQQASKAHPGLDALLSWYRQQQLSDAGEEAELRLESDEELVKIVTIHASKGLEYPIVFLPYLWGCRALEYAGRLVNFHDQEQRAFLELIEDGDSPHLFLAEKERLAEDLRLAYVALTRARAKVYLAWGEVNKGGRNPCSSGATALGYLLHPAQSPDELEQAFPSAFHQTRDMSADLRRLVEASGGTIELRELPDVDEAAAGNAPIEPVEPILPARFQGSVASDWHIASFSGLTRDIHQPLSIGGPNTGSDPILAFPAGSHVGSFLHLLLEQLDFQGDLAAQSLELTRQLAPRFGLDPEHHQETIVSWIQEIVTTTLDNRGLCLGRIGRRQRLSELEFDFSVQRVDISRLNKTLETAAGFPLARLEVDDFRGMITGIIDLVFEHEGRFYLADYKSNRLGGTLQAYLPERLRQAVLDRRYDLQYLLYTLALHRYLGQRLEGYRYDLHFGGAYYLFLRGMRQASGPRYGIFFERPEQQLVETLDQQVLAAGVDA